MRGCQMFAPDGISKNSSAHSYSVDVLSELFLGICYSVKVSEHLHYQFVDWRRGKACLCRRRRTESVARSLSPKIGTGYNCKSEFAIIIHVENASFS
jgi:hypothetical protein